MTAKLTNFRFASTHSSALNRLVNLSTEPQRKLIVRQCLKLLLNESNPIEPLRLATMEYLETSQIASLSLTELRELADKLFNLTFDDRLNEAESKRASDAAAIADVLSLLSAHSELTKQVFDDCLYAFNELLTPGFVFAISSVDFK